MSPDELLRRKQVELENSFREHHDAVRRLQRQALTEIVPDVAEQLSLDKEGVDWATEYLEDIGSIFRMFKRHKFIAPFAYEELRKTLLWRLKTLKRAIRSAPAPPLHCLPTDVRDPLGRPIIVVRLVEVVCSIDAMKVNLLASLEHMRTYLQSLNSGATVKGKSSREPVLQFVMVIDVEDAPIKATPVDLVSWYLHEVHPRFHGMLAVAFIVNYSWAYSGLWGVLKHLLPVSAISRVMFPSQGELRRLLPPSSQPPDYGGHISLRWKNSKLLPSSPPPRSSLSTLSSPPKPPDRRVTADPSPSVRIQRSFSRFSLVNPFFGYPVDPPPGEASLSRSIPELRHGRRRKRDLFRALCVLFWQRWKARISFGLLLLVVCSLVKLSMRTSRLYPGQRRIWRRP